MKTKQGYEVYQFVYRNKIGKRIEALVSGSNKKTAEERLKREAKGVNRVDVITRSEIADWYLREYGFAKKAEVISIT